MVTYQLLWAKLSRDTSMSETTNWYHPLTCHLLESAAVSTTLWERSLPPVMRSWISNSLKLTDKESARWCSFLVGAHDLGKASPVFQRKSDRLKAELESAGFPFSPFVENIPHGTISAIALEDYLRPRLKSQSVPRAAAWIVGGHHGTFPTVKNLRDARGAPRTCGTGPWKVARNWLLSVLWDTLGVGGLPSEVPASVAMALSGLVSVSDWIASDERHFPFAGGESITDEFRWEEYMEGALSRAKVAIDDLGWAYSRPSSPPPGFETLFPNLSPTLGSPPAPNDLQKKVIDHLRGDEPVLLLVEAPMGEGKTETALLATNVLGPRGFYVALPTQATSEQSFRRVSDYLVRRYPGQPVNIQLLHGHASLSEEVKMLREHASAILHPDENGPTPDREGDDQNVISAEWFTYRKRGLLAPFGVGTIDQILLADLAVRHVSVRLFGLAHKAVILDEVHAYDTYMESLTEGLVEWLAAMGASVVLLSATLPRARSASLLAAFARGRGESAPKLPHLPYPRISWWGSKCGGQGFQLDTSPKNRKTVHLEWLPRDIPGSCTESFPIGERLRVLLMDGGRAAVICNTVRRAQGMYRALSRLFPKNELDLLHAQFPLQDRKRREEENLRIFGKDRDPGIHRRILVATQVVEQSLDLDFDLMVTDFAPSDLMIQRAGRLHRHPREGRPPNMRVPKLLIAEPPLDDDKAPVFRDREAQIQDGWVYDQHALLRTWIVWKGRVSIEIPGDLEPLVEAVYDYRSPPPDLPDPLRNRWKLTLEAHKQGLSQQTYEAGIRRIGSPTCNELDNIVREPREEEGESPNAHSAFQALTRLSGPNQPIVVLDHTWQESVEWERSPGETLTAKLLERSLTLTHVGAVCAIQSNDAFPAPQSWKKSPLLRMYRLVRLNQDGTAPIPNSKYSLRLDPEAGLEVLVE